MIEAIAMGDFELTLITWLKGRSIGLLLFKAGILLQLYPVVAYGLLIVKQTHLTLHRTNK